MQLARRTRLATTSAPDDEPVANAHPTTIPGELDVVQRAQIDPLAFAPLYEHYAPIVYHYCLRRLSHPETAADATAIVFTKAIAALPKFTPDPRREGSTFRSWLFAIAHNVVVDTHRRNRNHVSLDAPSESLATSPRLVDPGQSPEDHAIAADANRLVRTLLARLPDRQRSIVELRLAGLSGAEIGRTLGMSESAVKSAQFRAYAFLRELFRDHDLAPDDLEPPR
jgi:RNA polymerase sigma-70 factor (ECF subfamily)